MIYVYHTVLYMCHNDTCHIHVERTVCQDAVDACFHASLSVQMPACSFGPLVICVFVWQVSCPRGQVLAVRQDVCTCYCALALPYPSNENQSTYPTLGSATPHLTLLPILQRKHGICHTLTSVSNALLPLKDRLEG